MHDDLVQVAPRVPQAAVLGTDLRDGGRTLGPAGPLWVTAVQDLQRARDVRRTKCGEIYSSSKLNPFTAVVSFLKTTIKNAKLETLKPLCFHFRTGMSKDFHQHA